MTTLLSRSALAKFSVFRKKWHFSPSKRIYIGFFWLEFEISASELTTVPNFSSIGQKMKELEFWHGTVTKMAWWRHTYLLVMLSENCLWFLRDFVSEYHRSKFGCNWTTNKGETDPKVPSLNRVEWNPLWHWIFYSPSIITCAHKKDHQP